MVDWPAVRQRVKRKESMIVQVRGATTAGQLAAAAEALEMALRRIALSSSWDTAQKPLGHGALNPGLGRRWAPNRCSDREEAPE